MKIAPACDQLIRSIARCATDPGSANSGHVYGDRRGRIRAQCASRRRHDLQGRQKPAGLSVPQDSESPQRAVLRPAIRIARGTRCLATPSYPRARTSRKQSVSRDSRDPAVQRLPVRHLRRWNSRRVAVDNGGCASEISSPGVKSITLPNRARMHSSRPSRERAAATIQTSVRSSSDSHSVRIAFTHSLRIGSYCSDEFGPKNASASSIKTIERVRRALSKMRVTVAAPWPT